MPLAEPRLLVLVRHAKSSWADASMSDHDRPLNDRGVKDAPVMAHQLVQSLNELSIDIPSLWLVSSALRTQRTYELMAANWGVAPQKIDEPALYEAPMQRMLHLIKGVPPARMGVGLIAHNPGTSMLLAHLTADAGLADLPTCAVAALRCHIATWADLSPEHTELIYYGYPKGVA